MIRVSLLESIIDRYKYRNYIKHHHHKTLIFYQEKKYFIDMQKKTNIKLILVFIRFDFIDFQDIMFYKNL
jgi:hypothetical protein